MVDELYASARRAMDRSVELQMRTTDVLAEVQRTLESREASCATPGRLRQLSEEVAGLRRAMESRAVIEQAKGIIIAATGCDPDQAFDVLVRQSQHENRKVAEIAAELVTSKIHQDRRQRPAV